MINPKKYAEKIGSLFSGVFGVPDSLLKNLNSEFDSFEPKFHQIASNEGSALALAVGRYLSTNIPSLVYLQNSGLGNCINPILSLASPEVYSAPVVLLIGWRGEPGVPDEPQHLAQGRYTEPLLTAVGVPFEKLFMETELALDQLERLRSLSIQIGGPVALLVSKDSFLTLERTPEIENTAPLMTREDALHKVLESIPPTDIVVATTGMLGRELYEARLKTPSLDNLDFLNVGAMGHAISISLGLATGKDPRNVWCLDGDGSVIMHAGGLAVVGDMQPKNLIHILFNNSVHDSVGGQPTPTSMVSFTNLARASGYLNASTVLSPEDVTAAIQEVYGQDGPTFLEIIVKPGHRKDLGRPKSAPRAQKEDFMKRLSDVRKK